MLKVSLEEIWHIIEKVPDVSLSTDLSLYHTTITDHDTHVCVYVVSVKSDLHPLFEGRGCSRPAKQRASPLVSDL